MFYGKLNPRTPTEKLTSKPQKFSQLPYLKRADDQLISDPKTIGMWDIGYIYVPKSCKDGESCRLHIAFHGCMQSAAQIGMDFVNKAGLNEWADANNIIVLYPQAILTNSSLQSYKFPDNPYGCWDWWGYNDKMYNLKLSSPTGARYVMGRYATSEGMQIAAVWRMAARLGNKENSASTTALVAMATPQVSLIDQSATQAVLRWHKVSSAIRYQIYRSTNNSSPVAIGEATSQLFYVDNNLMPSTTYRYTVHSITADQVEQISNHVDVTTAKLPPSCDPYVSRGILVDRNGKPTSQTCQ